MRETGLEGEDIAIRFLKKEGYKILEKNYRTPFGEIDIIASKNGVVVFIEVKARNRDLFGSPKEAVTVKKQERIKRSALYYLKGLKDMPPVRFDVISIDMGKNPGPFVEHIEYAFE